MSGVRQAKLWAHGYRRWVSGEPGRRITFVVACAAAKLNMLSRVYKAATVDPAH